MRIVVATVAKNPRKLRIICVTERPCSPAEDASANVFTRFPLQIHRNQREFELISDLIQLIIPSTIMEC